MRLPDSRQLADIRGVIFDLDGTLVDSRLDFSRIRRQLDCPDGVGVLEHVEALHGDDRAQALEAVLAFEREGAEAATWMPGAQEYLAWLCDQSQPVAILTRNAREVAALTVERLAIPVPLVLAREDCAPKPAPDGLLQIAASWQLPPQACVYIGDFIYDLQAARNAGMVACYYDPTGSAEFAQHSDWHIRHFRQLIPD